MLKGSATEQTAQLRNYLVRMMRDIQTIGSREEISSNVTRLIAESSSKAEAAAVFDARKRANDLKSLIIKTANEVYEVMDRRLLELNGIYVAQSDFGTYSETMQRTIEDTARATVESYEYTEQIEAVNTEIALMETYITAINGQIRRGIVEHPDTGESVLGITIAEELEFTGEVVDENGVTYYVIKPGQTFGLYTSRGWEFWVNGAPAGYFDAIDGKLHVSQVMIESTLNIGPDWEVTSSGGFGIRYIGG